MENNIPEKNSLDSMEGVEELGEFKTQIQTNVLVENEVEKTFEEKHFEKATLSLEKAKSIEQIIKDNIGTFDFFADGFFENLVNAEDSILDEVEIKDYTHIHHLFTLDIFNQLVERDLLNEEDKDLFCKSLPLYFRWSRIIEAWVAHKGPNQRPIAESKIHEFKLIINYFLPHLNKLIKNPKISEIDDVVSDRIYFLKVMSGFRQLTKDIEPPISVGEEWNKYCSERNIDKELVNKYPGIVNYANFLNNIVPSSLDGSYGYWRPVTHWPHSIAHSFRTASLDKEDRNNFYSILKLHKIMSNANQELGE